mgnify:CR=1 FL=1
MKNIFFAVILIGITLLSACTPAPVAGTPTPTRSPSPTATPAPSATPSPEPTRELTMNDLVPMFSTGNLSGLVEEDILPYLDITTGAEEKLRSLGFGEELDRQTEELMTFGGRSQDLKFHTLFPIYAYYPLENQLIYEISLYDQTCDCLLFPLANSGMDTLTASTGDVAELKDFIQSHPDASVTFNPLPIPAGITDGGELRLVATRSGIVPGVFYGAMFIGWFDPINYQWQLTQAVSEFLEARLENLAPEGSLEKNLSDWLSGTTLIPQSVLFEQRAGVPIKFNVFSRNQAFSANPSMKFYGVILGTKVIDNSLFLFIGFEDAASARYYLPFNLGRMDGPGCGTEFGTILSNLGTYHRYLDQSTNYSCGTLRLILGNYINAPALFTLLTGKLGTFPELSLIPGFSEIYNAQQEFASAAAKFIYNSAFSPIGKNTFEERINPAPDTVSAEIFPRIFITDIYVKK